MNQQLTVIGIKNAVFNDKKTGNEVSYCKLYVTFPDKNTVGIACEAISIKPELSNGLQPGDQISLFYNRYGKVEDIKVY